MPGLVNTPFNFRAFPKGKSLKRLRCTLLWLTLLFVLLVFVLKRWKRVPELHEDLATTPQQTASSWRLTPKSSVDEVERKKMATGAPLSSIRFTWRPAIHYVRDKALPPANLRQINKPAVHETPHFNLLPRFDDCRVTVTKS